MGKTIKIGPIFFESKLYLYLYPTFESLIGNLIHCEYFWTQIYVLDPNLGPHCRCSKLCDYFLFVFFYSFSSTQFKEVRWLVLVPIFTFRFFLQEIIFIRKMIIFFIIKTSNITKELTTCGSTRWQIMILTHNVTLPYAWPSNYRGKLYKVQKK